MRTLFSCLYGSSLYGTTIPSSDRDIKHVILPKFSDLLLGRAPKNKYRSTKTGTGKNSAEHIDVENIPLHILARDFMGGQSYALELVFAVDFNGAEQTIYDPRFRQFCHELRERFLTSQIRAIARYCADQAGLYSLKGERLNAVLATIELLKGFRADERLFMVQPFLEEKARLIEKEFPEYFHVTEYDASGKGAMRPCIKLLDKILPYTSSFRYNLQTAEALLAKFGSRAKQASESNVDWKATSHALRIVNEGITLLATGKLTFPLPDPLRTYLRQVRLGEIPYQQVLTQIETSLATLEEMRGISELPELTPELQLDLEVWLLGWLGYFYSDVLRQRWSIVRILEFCRATVSRTWTPLSQFFKSSP